MPKIIFIEASGKQHVVYAESGKSVMQSAVENLVPGIVGDCGGACSCATCHGYVDPAWLERVSPKSEAEGMMLEGALDTKANSRLTCQITLAPELDGFIVHLPASQY